MFRRVLPVLAATLLVACGGSGDGDDASSTPATAAAATTAPAATSATEQPAPSDADATATPEALQFTAPLVGGGEIELGALAGRPVLLWFWAPW